jgi:hypothetical protein
VAVDPAGRIESGQLTNVATAAQPAPLPGRASPRPLPPPMPGSARPRLRRANRRWMVVAGAVVAGMAGMLLWVAVRQRSAQVKSAPAVAIAPTAATSEPPPPSPPARAAVRSASSSATYVPGATPAPTPSASPSTGSWGENGTSAAGLSPGTHSSRPLVAPQTGPMPAPVWPALDTAAAEDRHRRETATARDRVRAGMTLIQADLEGEAGKQEQRLDECRERLEKLASLAAANQPELAAELARAHQLEKQIANALLETRSAAREAALASAAWQRRMGEIETLLADRSYPEAKRLAERLAAEPTAPPEVAARARELAVQAERELKRIFGKGRFGNESNQLQQAPPP